MGSDEGEKDGSVARLMPGYDPDWRQRVLAVEGRLRELLARADPLSEAERAELMGLGAERDAALNSRFRTTKDYRDFYCGRARQLLEDEGIDMPLPPIADDATPEEVDRVLELVWRAVEVTNSETF
jgi:hypothetical protein